MQIQITGKHMDLGDALRGRIETGLEAAVSKYFNRTGDARVFVSQQGPFVEVDCNVHLPSGIILQSTGKAGDPYAALEDSLDKMEKRVRRYKRRLKDHHANGGGHKALAYQVMEAIPEEVEEIPEDYAPAIIAETTLKVGTLSVAGAVMELDRQDGPIVLFRNAQSGDINIVFRRPDGNVGWIDPSTYSAEA